MAAGVQRWQANPSTHPSIVPFVQHPPKRRAGCAPLAAGPAPPPRRARAREAGGGREGGRGWVGREQVHEGAAGCRHQTQSGNRQPASRSRQPTSIICRTDSRGEPLAAGAGGGALTVSPCAASCSPASSAATVGAASSASSSEMASCSGWTCDGGAAAAAAASPSDSSSGAASDWARGCAAGASAAGGGGPAAAAGTALPMPGQRGERGERGGCMDGLRSKSAPGSDRRADWCWLLLSPPSRPSAPDSAPLAALSPPGPASGRRQVGRGCCISGRWVLAYSTRQIWCVCSHAGPGRVPT